MPQRLAHRLAELTLFSGVDEADLLEVARHADLLHLADGEQLFSQGEAPRALYLVLGGAVRVVVGGEDGLDVVVGEVGAGGLLGELGVLDGTPRSASAHAAGAAEVLAFPAAILSALIEGGHPVGAAWLRALRVQLAGRVRALDARVDAVFGRVATDALDPVGVDALRAAWLEHR